MARAASFCEDVTDPATCETVGPFRAVTLEWTTASEIDNTGFEVQRHDAAADRFVTEGFVEGAGTTDAPQAYRFRVDVLEAGMHRFRLRQIDTDGQAAYSHEVTVRVGHRWAVRTPRPGAQPRPRLERASPDDARRAAGPRPGV